MHDPSSPVARQLHFVSGKGGVGKSVIACALARAFVQQGHPTLLLQVNASDSHRRLLDSRPIGADVTKLEHNLYAANMTPQDSLREYALLVLKLEMLYRAVFENRFTRAFLRFVPSLAELTMLGKTWYHATEESGGAPRFPRIVVDLPSTGHALKFLKVARAVHDATRFGPMAEKTAEMAQLVADPRRSALHIVTIPEDLPVTEALELFTEVQRSRVVPSGLFILNRVSDTLFDDVMTQAFLAFDAAAREERGRTADATTDDGAADMTAPTVVDALRAVGRRRQLQERKEIEERARLAQSGATVIDMPELLVDTFGRPQIDIFAERLLGAMS